MHDASDVTGQEKDSERRWGAGKEEHTQAQEKRVHQLAWEKEKELGRCWWAGKEEARERGHR